VLFALVFLPFLTAALVACLPGSGRGLSAWIAGLTALAGCALLALAGPAVFAGEVLRASVPWFPGVALAFRLDGLAFLFVLLICAIGALVVLYAHYYLAPGDPAPRFFAFLLVFMGAMLGIVTAGNLILLVAFWEITSLASFLLIGYWTHRADARGGARMALIVTGFGGLCLLAGVLVLGAIVGSHDLDAVLSAGPRIRADPRFPLALGLILVGAFAKSAQVPFYFWLPDAMAAPTPVSAYLHSATMVKAGVFLLARLYPALGDNDLWFYWVGGVGMGTMLLGAALALFQQDLKGLLAYSTISHLGLITLLFGLDSPLAVVAAVFHIINHATFKASLFMAAGIIDHESGTRDMRRLNGLWRCMPITATLAMVASAAMAGVPLLNGFLSKEMFFAETTTLDRHGIIDLSVPVGAAIAGALAVAYSIRFIHDVFFNGEPVDLPRAPHEPPRWMRVPVEVLVVVCLAVGIVPALTVGPLLAVAARATLGGTLPEYSLAIWHGVNQPLLMSIAALGLGTLLYFSLQRFVNLHTVAQLPTFAKAVFDALLRALDRIARFLVTTLPGRGLRAQLFVLLAAAGALTAWPLVVTPPGTATLAVEPPPPGVAVVGVAVWLIGVLGAIAATLTYRRRLLALVLLGATGLAVSLAFVLLSAPDLALTQLLVEVATVLLLMVVLHYLPQSAPPERALARQSIDGALALALGIGVTLLVHAVLMRAFDPLSSFYLARSLPEGGGANVVNVIIVDFRGFDTLGEITVLGIAALAVGALLARFRPPAAHRAIGAVASYNPLLVRNVTRLLLPLAALVATYLFLRGHNEPGGGFIAGLVLAIAILVLRVAGGGPRWTDASRLRLDAWIAAGLVVAGLTGIGSTAFGYPFLTSAFGHPVLPVIGEVPLASASLFDLGVFLTVVGATLLAVLAPGLLDAAANQEGA
jgi:multicomponent K+:H+ antiporter subunit A